MEPLRLVRVIAANVQLRLFYICVQARCRVDQLEMLQALDTHRGSLV